MNMNKMYYTEKKTFLKYDDEHFIVYLNEEVVENYVQPSIMGESNEPITAYAYTGPMPDGGTLIQCTSPDRDSLINGIIRSRYSQTEEDAIKTHQILVLQDAAGSKAESYQSEWNDFIAYREYAISVVDGWLN